jgi:predicted metalloprotease with PDZ domain
MLRAQGRGMKRLWRPIAAAFAFILCTAQAPSQRIEYVISPVMQNGELRSLQFDLTFRGQGDGETDLRLPDEWGGQPELWRGIEGLEVVSGATMRDGASVHERILTHTPNGRVHLRYRVIQDWEGVPTAASTGNPYRPIIQPTYFHLIGEAAMVTPDLHPATPVRVRKRDMPRGWAFASDLEHPGMQLGRVWASVTVGGDYRVRRALDANIRVAIRGEWRFTDQAFITEVNEIITGHRNFWGDRTSPYLVTVTQTAAPNPNWLSIGGTGLDDAFAFFATPNAELAPIARTLAHESFHTWTPGRIGGLNQDATEPLGYWLSEGLTDFYTGRMLVREGLWTPQDFANDFNEMLSAYAQSPVRTAPNTRIQADFWSDRDVQQLPYQRGRMLATIWDRRLSANGRNLDWVVREMRERAIAGDPARAPEMFPIVMASAGVDISADIETYVDRGEAVLLPEDLLAPCGRIVTAEAAVFDRGFDPATVQAQGGVIGGVDPTLPAYAAGMRDGMVFVRRNGGVIGDPDTQITYVVRDNGVERSISYYPRGHRTFQRQRLELNALEGESLTQCISVIGGA